MKIFGFVSVLLFSIAMISLSKSNNIEPKLLEIKPWKTVIYAPTFSASGISIKCSGDTRRYVEALSHGEKWANSMYEASGKLSEDFYNFTSVGIRGSRTSRHETGLFDQCISIGLEEFEGQYCKIFFELKPVTEEELRNDGKRKKTPAIKNNISFSFPDSISSIVGTIDFCLPSSCTAQDLKTAVSQIVGVNNIGPGNNYSVVTIGNENYCHSRGKIASSSSNLKNPAILLFLSIFIILVFLVALRTVFEALNVENMRSNHPILLSFSAISNGRHLIFTRQGTFDNISCMNGIQNLLAYFILFMHAAMDIIKYQSFFLFSILASVAINHFIGMPFKNLQHILFKSIKSTDVTLGKKSKQL